MQQFSIRIDAVVDLLGLERAPGGRRGRSFQVKCPFCDDPKYHMNIDTMKNTYNCFRCGGSHSGGGALDLYGRAALGIELIPGKKEDGGNGNILYAKLAEALGMENGQYHYARTRRGYSDPTSNKPTSDENLNKAYSAVLDFPEFKLTDTHYDNLRRRGLDDATIVRNGYRSIRRGCDWVRNYNYRNTVEEYDQLGIESAAKNYKKINYLSENLRLAGYIVAQSLERQEVSMEGVPGFFRLKGKWMFRMEPGMLIPTRNRDGLIVGMQVRKDSGNLRYMTVSSKSLPDGVDEGISRAHFPLANAPLSNKAKILITEGPLKADVAQHLLGREDILMVAIPGVSHISLLKPIFDKAKEAGIKVIYNCFDMDKITNPNVAAASRKIRELAKSYKLIFHPITWDQDYAQAKWMELYGLCQHLGIPAKPLPDEPSILFLEVGRMAVRLHEKGVRHSCYMTQEGMVKRYWSDETKGIDDFLLRNPGAGESIVPTEMVS